MFYTIHKSVIRPMPYSSKIPVSHPPFSFNDIRNNSENGFVLSSPNESSLDFSNEGPKSFS